MQKAPAATAVAAEAPSPRIRRGKSTGRPDGTAATLSNRVRVSRPLAAVVALAAAATLTAAPHAAGTPGKQYVAPAGSGALFLFTGHGWGHGVGMGQWGAEGYALQGYTYEQILAAYYPGTIFGQTSATSIRVLLANGKSQLTISSGHPIDIQDGDDIDYTLSAGKTALTPSLELAVDGGPKQALTPPLT